MNERLDRANQTLTNHALSERIVDSFVHFILLVHLRVSLSVDELRIDFTNIDLSDLNKSSTSICIVINVTKKRESLNSLDH